MLDLTLFNQSESDYFPSVSDTRILLLFPEECLSISVTPPHSTQRISSCTLHFLSQLSPRDLCHLSKGGYFLFQKLHDTGRQGGRCPSCVSLVLSNHLFNFPLHTFRYFDANSQIEASPHASHYRRSDIEADT